MKNPNRPLKLATILHSFGNWPPRSRLGPWKPTLVVLLTVIAHAQAQPTLGPAKVAPSPVLSLGASATVTASVLSGTPTELQWMRNGVDLSREANPSAKTAVLRLTNVTQQDEGNYQLLARSSSGSVVSAPVFLDVDESWLRMPNLASAAGYSFGCAVGDYNEDGAMDIAVANGFDGPGLLSIYRNQGDGAFVRATSTEVGPPAGDSKPWVLVRWADLNNDGHPDLLASEGVDVASAKDYVYFGQGKGKFTSAVRPADLGRSRRYAGLILPADYNQDGFLDLLSGQASVKPESHLGLYRNLGDGAFAADPSGSTMSADVFEGNAAIWSDYDGDGDPDLFSANVSDRPDYFYRNDGGGKFTRITEGLPVNSAGSSISPAWGDYDNDGDLDLLITKRFKVLPILLRNDGATFSSGPEMPASATNSGAMWVDYDNDGWLDIFFGHGQDGALQNVVAHNNGDGTFTSVINGLTAEFGTWTGAGLGDFDNNGSMDLFLVTTSGQHVLYRNENHANHWIKLNLKPSSSSKSPFGAKVRVLATIRGKSVWQLREISSGNYMQEDPRPNFGLGDATTVERVRIEWPSGNVQELTDVAADQIVSVTELVYISPTRPSGSVGGSVSLTALRSGTYQWYHDGAALTGQTGRQLTRTNLAAGDAGRYSVVAQNENGLFTNSVHLFVDTQFVKVRTGAVVTDNEGSWGCNWVDYDQDGNLDLFVGNGFAAGQSQRNALYRNDGKGNLLRVTAAEAGPLVSDASTWLTAAWGDFDNDGFPDVLAEGPQAVFYRNLGNGMFERRADLLPKPARGAFVSSLADYDGDGWLDCFRPEAVTGLGHNALWHNNSGLSLTRVEQSPLVTDVLGDPMAAAWGDYDGDGDQDLVVASYSLAPLLRLYRNLGGGVFERASTDAWERQAPGALVPSWADYDNDGRLDLFVSVFGSPSLLFHNNGGGVLTSQRMGIGGEQGYPAWGDYDNDGWLDLFLSRGQTSDDVNQLWHNNGNGSFSQIYVGSLVTDPGRAVGGAAWGDYDNDGFLDLFVARSEPNLLYHNQGNSNHWLKVELKGTTSNRSALGAKVRVRAAIGSRAFWQLREPPVGNRSQGDPRLHFGLGNATNVAVLRVEWPSGTVQEFSNLAPNQLLTIVEPRRPVLAVTALLPARTDATLKADPQTTYVLESSNDLVLWETLTTTTTDAAGAATWSDSGHGPLEQRFYRARRVAP